MSTRRPPCPRCGRTHHAGYARAVGLFGPSLVTRYRATYPDAPERHTRDQAVQDMCDRYAAELHGTSQTTSPDITPTQHDDTKEQQS